MMLDSIRPFSKLTQDNIAAFAAFATAPEVVAQSTTSVTQWLQRAGQDAAALSGSRAYGRLMMALMQNYTEFLAEMGQSAAQAFSQGQSALLSQTQDAGEAVAEAVASPRRRSR